MNNPVLKSLVVLACVSLAPCLVAQERKLVKKWETEATLKVPESVLYDAGRNVLYVANIGSRDAWANDGDGSIGRLGLDGKIKEVEWVTGLHGPKGMGLWKDRLYVADNTRIVVIDIEKAAIVETIDVAGAQNLNDVSIDANGGVFFSDSKAKRVHKLVDGEVTVVLENLKGPNGVLAHDGTFYVLDSGGLYRMAEDKSLSLIVDGMEGGTDGVENLRGSEFIVSTWSGVIYHVDAERRTKETLLDTRAQRINSADIGIDAKTGTIYVPTFFTNTVVAYEVK